MGRKDKGTSEPTEGKIVLKGTGPRSDGASPKSSTSNANKHVTQWRAGRGSI